MSSSCGDSHQDGGDSPQQQGKGQEKVSAEWDAMAGDWDDMASGYANGFYDLLLERVGADLLLPSTAAGGGDDPPPSPKPPLTVVDFGCGTGLLTEKLLRNLGSRISSIVAIDAAPKMVQVLKEKIRDKGWEERGRAGTTVQAYHAVLANLEDEKGSTAASTRSEIEALYERVDLIVASSVLSFVPEADAPKTMKVLGRLLKPDGVGLLCHSDWPKSDSEGKDDDDHSGMTEDMARKLYGYAGLEPKSMEVVPINMGPSSPSSSSPPEQPQAADVFFGVAATTKRN